MENFSNTYFMNIAPTMSSESGMLRLVAEMDGERVLSVDPHIGFSHKGVEKTLEYKNVFQGLCCFDALYVPTALAQEYSFVLAVEKLAGLDVPERASVIRSVLAELTRIQSHLTAMANMASDVGVGAAVPIVVRTTRQIARLFRMACGRYIPSAFFRPGGIAHDIFDDFFNQLLDFITTPLPKVTEELKQMLTENGIFRLRTQNIGVIDAEKAKSFGFSGVNLRASGVAWDLRREMPYDAYAKTGFNILTRREGDCFARCCLRLSEIEQSADLIKRFIKMLPKGDILSKQVAVPETTDKKQEFSTQERILHLARYAVGLSLPEGEVFCETESPFGAFGVYLVSKGDGPFPYRCHIRSAGFPHLQALNDMMQECLLEDVRVVASSLDIKMSEVDR